jgi:hypothetical protein
MKCMRVSGVQTPPRDCRAGGENRRPHRDFVVSHPGKLHPRLRLDPEPRHLRAPSHGTAAPTSPGTNGFIERSINSRIEIITFKEVACNASWR